MEALLQSNHIGVPLMKNSATPERKDSMQPPEATPQREQEPEEQEDMLSAINNMERLEKRNQLE